MATQKQIAYIMSLMNCSCNPSVLSKQQASLCIDHLRAFDYVCSPFEIEQASEALATLFDGFPPDFIT